MSEISASGSQNSWTKLKLGARRQTCDLPRAAVQRVEATQQATWAWSCRTNSKLFLFCEFNKSHVLPVTKHMALSSRLQPPRNPLLRALRHTLAAKRSRAHRRLTDHSCLFRVHAHGFPRQACHVESSFVYHAHALGRDA